jgi:hypothetical protein
MVLDTVAGYPAEPEMLDIALGAPVSKYDQWFVGAPPMEAFYAYDYRLDINRLVNGVRDALARMPELSCCVLHDGEGGHMLGHVPGLLKVEVIPGDDPAAELDRFACLRKYVGPVDGSPGTALCTVRVTSGPSGDVLGLGLSHLIADGFTRRCFVEHLIAAHRGDPVPEAFRYQSTKLTQLEGPYRTFRSDGSPVDGPPPPPFHLIRRTSRHAYAARVPRAWLQAQLEHLSRIDDRLTEGDIISAHCVRLWGVQMFGAQERLRVRVAVDVRQCLPEPDLSLVGNALIDAVLPIEIQAWKQAELGAAASLIHDCVAQLRSVIKTAAKAHIAGTPLDAQTWFNDLWEQTFTPYDHTTDLSVGNLMRLPGDLDFGCGPPKARFNIASASNSFLIFGLSEDLLIDMLSTHPVDIEPSVRPRRSSVESRSP